MSLACEFLSSCRLAWSLHCCFAAPGSAVLGFSAPDPVVPGFLVLGLAAPGSAALDAHHLRCFVALGSAVPDSLVPGFAAPGSAALDDHLRCLGALDFSVRGFAALDNHLRCFVGLAA